jgi:hypothetical protein
VSKTIQYDAEESRRLLAQGYRIVLFIDGMGSVSALAVNEGVGLDQAVRRWKNYESPGSVTLADSVFDGPNRMCGCGHTVAAALHATTTKVLHKRLPEQEDGYRLKTEDGTVGFFDTVRGLIHYCREEPYVRGGYTVEHVRGGKVVGTFKIADDTHLPNEFQDEPVVLPFLGIVNEEPVTTPGDFAKGDAPPEKDVCEYTKACEAWKNDTGGGPVS